MRRGGPMRYSIPNVMLTLCMVSTRSDEKAMLSTTAARNDIHFFQ